MVADCPRSGLSLGSWDTRVTVTQPPADEPAAGPRQAGQAPAAAGRPGHVLVDRAAGGGLHRPGRRGRDVLVFPGRDQPRAGAGLRRGQRPEGRRGDPRDSRSGCRSCPTGWQANSGGRGGIADGRTDPSTGQRLRAVTSTVGYISPAGEYLSLTQSNADEDKLVGSIHPSMYPTGAVDVNGTRWVTYQGTSSRCRAGVDDTAQQPGRPCPDRDHRCRKHR